MKNFSKLGMGIALLGSLVTPSLKCTIALPNEEPLNQKNFKSSKNTHVSKDIYRDYLRNGLAPNFLDLHGLRFHEARKEFLKFMKEALRNNVQKVTVITGRGAHSNLKDGEYGILSRSLPQWLKEGNGLKKHIKHCDLSAYGGCYTFILRINPDIPPMSAFIPPKQQHAHNRSVCRQKANLRNQHFRKMKHRPNFLK